MKNARIADAPSGKRPPRVCGYCNAPAVWRWKPKDPPPAFNQFMCDNHAARIDLDDLELL